MRRRLAVLLIAGLLGASCGDAGSDMGAIADTSTTRPATDSAEADSTTTQPTETTPPSDVGEPTSGTAGMTPERPVTWVISDTLATPVPHDGEPSRRREAAGFSGPRTRFMSIPIRFNDDWTSRDSLSFCEWTASLGTETCFGMSLVTSKEDFRIGVSGGYPEEDTELELWLADDRGLLRRLLVVDLDNPPNTPLAFPEGWTNVNDVLTNPPPEGGNYLVPIGVDDEPAPARPRGDEPPNVDFPALTPVAGPATISFEDADSGVVSSWEPAQYERVEEDASLSPISINDVSCAMEWPGRIRWSGDIALPDDVTLPAHLLVSLGVTIGDLGHGPTVEAVFESSGPFTITVDGVTEHRDPDSRSWGGSTWHATREIGQWCDVEVIGEHPTESTWGEIAWSPGNVTLNAPGRSVEELLQGLDGATEDHPLIGIAELLNHDIPIDVNGVWLAPTDDLTSISIGDARDGCVRIFSHYGDFRVQVTQQRGDCNPPYFEDDEVLMGVIDGVWEVRLVGSPAALAAFVPQLERRPFAGLTVVE